MTPVEPIYFTAQTKLKRTCTVTLHIFPETTLENGRPLTIQTKSPCVFGALSAKPPGSPASATSPAATASDHEARPAESAGARLLGGSGEIHPFPIKGAFSSFASTPPGPGSRQIPSDLRNLPNPIPHTKILSFPMASMNSVDIPGFKQIKNAQWISRPSHCT